MFGYIFILLSVLFNAAKGYSSKRVSATLDTTYKNFSFNIIRLLISFLFALVVALIGKGDFFKVGRQELLICIIAGISMAGFACLWQVTIRSKAYMLASACSSASFVLPVLFGLVFWNEKLTLTTAFSILLIIVALIFLLRYDSKLNGKISIKEIICLAFLLISQGTMQCAQKMYALHATEKDSSIYNLYMFLFATCAATAFLLFIRKDGLKEETVNKRAFDCKNLIYLVIMSGSLFAVSLFQSLAAKTVDAIILYPLISGLSLAAGSVMSAIMFKEKPDKNSVIGVILVLFAVILSKF